VSDSIDTDLLIIGGGLAAMALANRLIESGARFQVRIIEPRDDFAQNRAWGLWAPARHALSPFVNARWTRWSFSRDGGGGAEHAIPGLSYQLVESGPLFARRRDRIGDAPHIRLETGITAHQTGHSGGSVFVETNAGRLRARHVIDTRPVSASSSQIPVMYQSFAGCLSQDGGGTASPCAEIMTRMRCDSAGLAFDYVLPLGDGRVRTEAVRWSPVPLERARLETELDELLSRRRWTRAGPVSYGVLPTGLPAPREHPVRGLVAARMQAGGWRAGAGQSLLRLENWAGTVTRRLLAGRAPPAFHGPGLVAGLANRRLLSALTRDPSAMDRTVLSLAGSLPPATLVHVMTGNPGVRDSARLMLHLRARADTS
jgi:lycopene beta-cyclase